MWDVTVVDTLAQSYVAATSQLAGSAADAAEARKQRKYQALEQQFIVQPIGFETMGSWGAGAKAFLADISVVVILKLILKHLILKGFLVLLY